LREAGKERGGLRRGEGVARHPKRAMLRPLPLTSPQRGCIVSCWLLLPLLHLATQCSRMPRSRPQKAISALLSLPLAPPPPRRHNQGHFFFTTVPLYHTAVTDGWGGA
jgi:hypothetical protein